MMTWPNASLEPTQAMRVGLGYGFWLAGVAGGDDELFLAC